MRPIVKAEPILDVTRRRNQKRIVVRRLNENHFRVSAPPSTTLREIKKLIRTHENKLSRMPAQPDFHRALKKPSTVMVFNHPMPVVYQTGPKAAHIQENRVVITAPDLTVDVVAALLKRALKNYLLATLEDWHKTMQTRHPELTAFSICFDCRYTLSRFGSCNRTKNRINLNLGLVHYPLKFLKSVYAHEITHLFVAGHTPAFYRKLQTFDPNYRENKQTLKQHHRVYLRDNATTI